MIVMSHKMLQLNTIYVFFSVFFMTRWPLMHMYWRHPIRLDDTGSGFIPAAKREPGQSLLL